MGTRLKNKLSRKKSASNYHRHKKAPTLYSPEYHNWVQAVKKNLDPSFAAAKHDAYIGRIRRVTTRSSVVDSQSVAA